MTAREVAAVILRHIHLWGDEELTVADFASATCVKSRVFSVALQILKEMGAVTSRADPGGDALLYRPAYVVDAEDPLQRMIFPRENLRRLNAMVSRDKGESNGFV